MFFFTLQGLVEHPLHVFGRCVLRLGLLLGILLVGFLLVGLLVLAGDTMAEEPATETVKDLNYWFGLWTSDSEIKEEMAILGMNAMYDTAIMSLAIKHTMAREGKGIDMVNQAKHYTICGSGSAVTVSELPAAIFAYAMNEGYEGTDPIGFIIPIFILDNCKETRR
jgi:hypothetical protein